MNITSKEIGKLAFLKKEKQIKYNKSNIYYDTYEQSKEEICKACKKSDCQSIGLIVEFTWFDGADTSTPPVCLLMTCTNTLLRAWTNKVSVNKN